MNTTCQERFFTRLNFAEKKNKRSSVIIELGFLASIKLHSHADIVRGTVLFEPFHIKADEPSDYRFC